MIFATQPVGGHPSDLSHSESGRLAPPYLDQGAATAAPFAPPILAGMVGFSQEEMQWVAQSQP